MDIFLFAFNAILPILLTILLGYTLRRVGLIKNEFLTQGNKFIFAVCLPILLYQNIYDINSIKDINFSVIIFVVIMILLIFLLGLIVVNLFIKDNRQKGVILQSTFRSNYAIIGISLATQLAGDKGKAIASLISAFSVPTYNILSVIALTIFIKDNKLSLKNTFKNILKNPLIIACIIALLILGIRSFIPTNDLGVKVFSIKNNLPFLYTTLKNIANITSPLALIILGAKFEFKAVYGMFKPILIGTIMKTMIVPFIAITSAILVSRYIPFFHFDSSIYPSLVALFSTPVAVASAIMADQMKNDGILAGQLVIWTSICSVFTIFIIILILRSMSLL